MFKSMFDNKRAEERLNLLYYLPVYRHGQDSIFARVADISPEGMLLIANDAPEPDSELALRMKLPEEFAAGDWADFSVQVRWHQPDATGRHVAVGVHLSDNGDLNEALINQLEDQFCIESFRFREGDDNV